MVELMGDPGEDLRKEMLDYCGLFAVLKSKRRVNCNLRHHFSKVKSTINTYSHRKMQKLMKDDYFKLIYTKLYDNG